MKHLTSENLRYYGKALREAAGLLGLAALIPDEKLRESVCAKIEAASEAFRAQYGEEYNDDGSMTVRHPGIGIITIDEIIPAEPERLFAARVKSLTLLKVRVFHADALIDKDGGLTYINRRLEIEMDMTQAAFAGFVSTGMGQSFPSTIREYKGEAYPFEGDIQEIRTKLLLNDVIGGMDKLDDRALDLINGITAAAGAGKALSKKAGDAIIHDGSILRSWVESNPSHYAKTLGEFTARTTADIKLEVNSLVKARSKVQ